MRHPSQVLTGQELEIMKVVWDLKKATVRDVYQELLKRRQVAYTTVMTMMNILEQKKYLKKRENERAYLYTPVQSKHKVVSNMVREFIDRVFSGSAEPLLVHLMEDRHVSEDDLREIAALRRKRHDPK
jgi:predicted transcriptional regulator